MNTFFLERKKEREMVISLRVVQLFECIAETAIFLSCLVTVYNHEFARLMSR